MLNVGLTGGIGCGKSTAVNAFRELGAMIIDADQVARDIVEPGTKALTQIAEHFGDDFDACEMVHFVFTLMGQSR